MFVSTQISECNFPEFDNIFEAIINMSYRVDA